MRVLVIGRNSFIAKNFIEKYSKKIKLFYFNLYFNDNYKNYNKKIFSYANKKKIDHIINFIGNNDNSLYPLNAKNIFRDNFILPISLVDIFKEKKINFTFFLSSEINKIEKSKENNLYALSKIFLRDSLKFISKNNKISLIKIDNVYGPYDLNFKRLIPSLMLKILLKKNIKINLKQKRKLIYIKNLLPIIFKSIQNKKLINIVNVRGKNINILYIWKMLNKNLHIGRYKKFKNRVEYNFFETLQWYKANQFIMKKKQKN